MPEIRYTDWGIASRIGDTIWMNRKLREIPELYDAILEHERQHTKGYTFKDFMLDFRNNHIKGRVKRQYWAFVARNPKSWVEFLPFGYYDSQIVINPSILLYYGLGMILFGGLIWILG